MKDMNFDFAKPNLDDKVLKYVSMAESISKMGKNYDKDSIIKELKDTKDYKDNILTDLDIEKIVEILKDRKIF
jgi:hypothetical protein